MRRDLMLGGVIWAVVTFVSIAVTALFMDPFPTQGAEEASIVDDAFFVLTYMAAPVFGVVVAVLILGVLRWRSPGEPAGDGPPLFGTGAVPWIWLGLTSALTVVVIIYPGLSGLFELRENQHADMRVEVTALQWQWQVYYPAEGIRLSSALGDELVLPVDTRIEFDITAGENDVLHSFWIPAFRQKIDAVPGLHTTIFTTVNRTGTPDDAAYRLQCAELCGLNHTDMAMAVRVVERSEFTAWVASRISGATPSEGGEGTVQGSPVAEFFQATCAVCHGDQRQGGIGLPLTPERLIEADEFYFETIKNGRDGTAMPAWGLAGLSDADIRTLVEFLRTPVE